MHFDNTLWVASVASGLLAALVYYQNIPDLGWVMLITSVTTGAAAVLLGILRRMTRGIIAGAMGLMIAFSVWFGYGLYQSSHGWLEGISKTG